MRTNRAKSLWLANLSNGKFKTGLKRSQHLRFESLSIEDELARKLLLMFDGTKTRKDVLQEIEKNTEFKNEEEKQEFLNDLPVLLDEHIKRMSDFGIFVS